MQQKKIHPLINKNKQRIAKKYHGGNRKISIASYAVSGILVFILVFLNVSRNYTIWLSTFVGARVLLIFFYYTTLHVIYSTITFPLSYVGGYLIEHKYDFSTQNFSAWFLDRIKSFIVGFIIGAFIFEALYIITNASAHFWWLWLSLIMVLFTVILTNIFPVIILPLFYKTKPIEEGELKHSIDVMCARAKVDVQGVYSINLSSKSTKTNAAVVGLGSTKRILLGDTFIADYEQDEIMAVLAHEITHYKEHHMWWLILWQALITVALFYILYLFHPYVYQWCGFDSIADVAAFPLFAFLFAVLSIIINPIGSGISRYYERRADRGALNLTQNPNGFIAVMAKFCNKQLAIAYPSPIVEWYKYSHPSPGKRIAFAEQWKEKPDRATL